MVQGMSLWRFYGIISTVSKKNPFFNSREAQRVRGTQRKPYFYLSFTVIKRGSRQMENKSTRGISFEDSSQGPMYAKIVYFPQS